MEKYVSGAMDTEVQLQNEHASLTIDLFGGAISAFQLQGNSINPLSFRFSREQMPKNNKAGAAYQGHFLCLGRWGEPSDGEKKAGVPNHGQFANIMWELDKQAETQLNMSATGTLEGLQVNRSITLDGNHAAFAVTETVTNINPLGRLYNMVQHPSLSPPFLDKYTRIDCNATVGFNQHFSDQPDKYSLSWPQGYCEDGSTIDLRIADKPYSSVFSFIVDPESNLGWITAYSPEHKLLLGYIWKREDYPWIHLWQHWEEKELKYKGIEFGTAGIHKPFKEILGNLQVFGERTLAYIDAGETVSRRYISVLTTVADDFSGVKSIAFKDGEIHIKGNRKDQDLYFKTSFNDFL